MRDHLFGACVAAHLRIYAKAPIRHFRDGFHLGCSKWRADFTPCIGKEF